jgi:hypothetical protein
MEPTYNKLKKMKAVDSWILSQTSSVYRSKPLVLIVRHNSLNIFTVVSDAAVHFFYFFKFMVKLQTIQDKFW